MLCRSYQENRDLDPATVVETMKALKDWDGVDIRDLEKTKELAEEHQRKLKEAEPKKKTVDAWRVMCFGGR